MATLQTPLLSVNNSSRIPPRYFHCSTVISKKYRTVCVTVKAGWFVLIILAILNALGFNSIFYFITTPNAVGNETVFLLSYSFFIMELLMFPAVGLLGEVTCKRFKVLILGAAAIGIGAVVFIIVFIVWQDLSSNNHVFSFLLFGTYLLIIPGIGIFQANALQYGIDQLDFPSSEVLSSFVYWYYWTSYAFISPLIAISLYGEFYFITTVLCLTAILLPCLLCLTAYCCCKYPLLRFDPGRKVNPLRLIWKVMQFVRGRKSPLLRSAFTYNETWSQLDLAKQRYGGPFTTEEVEDVKTFWRILLVLGTLIGFQLQDDTLFTVTKALFLSQHFCSYFLTSVWAVTSLVIAIAIPAYQFCIRPYLSRRIPNMLTRMGIGLLFILISLLATTTYNIVFSHVVSELNITSLPTVWNGSECETAVNFSSSVVCSSLKGFFQSLPSNEDGRYLLHPLNGSVPCFSRSYTTYDNYLPSFYWLIIPQALNGLAHMLVFLTTLEFILAQAPRTMQGFLIGLWYAMQSVNVGISIIGYVSCAVFNWQYYATKTSLVSLSLILFAIAARKYKYRQLNEDADINVRQQVEEVFERNIEQEAVDIFTSEQGLTLGVW